MEVTVMPAAAPVQKQQGLNQGSHKQGSKNDRRKTAGCHGYNHPPARRGKNRAGLHPPIGVNLRNEDRHPVITFQAEEQVQMNMPEGNFNLHGNAISQISEKMGIPAKYLRELSAGDAWQKQLCATILNEHSGWTGRTRVLIRAVGTEIRGVLSDSYRRLNSVDILTAFIREAANNGAVVSGRLYE